MLLQISLYFKNINTLPAYFQSWKEKYGANSSKTKIKQNPNHIDTWADSMKG